MILESIGRDTFARETGLILDEGGVSDRGLADLLRMPLCRWGLCPRSAVLRHANDQLAAAGLQEQASQRLPEVLESLVRFGECEDLRIGRERYVAPGLSRWIRTGEESAALLSVAPAPKGIVERTPDRTGRDIIRRIRIRTDDDLTALRMAEVRETSIGDWLSPHGYQQHATRRTGRPIRGSEFSLSQFWDLLIAAVVEHGLPLGEDADVRTVAGEPGGFFGRYNAEAPEGRWAEVAPDGFWCGFRRGYGQGHWHPIILCIDGSRKRAMDLHDHDEWRWALLSRGDSVGSEERVNRSDSLLRVTFPAPNQLATAMDILGPRRSSWSWDISPEAPDPWAAIR